ncbi:hypothetical protein ABE504_21995 [Paenibacillus oryzisoli]|uniref:hypothetical protein n=1 Tax=Paenibacillus oryzisoli TaxID=1850517 RepID=UPI003D2DA4BB
MKKDQVQVFYHCEFVGSIGKVGRIHGGHRLAGIAATLSLKDELSMHNIPMDNLYAVLENQGVRFISR